MKTKTFLSILAFGLIVSAFSQKPSLELTFRAQNNGQHVQLDSILTENLTQGGDTMLYAPDTVLLLYYASGIGSSETIEQSAFIVSQNYPNPFNGTTSVSVYLADKEHIKIFIRDVLGRELVFYENTLNRGNHCFTFYSGKDKYYLLTGIAGQTSHTIKMLNANTSRDYQGKCKFVYDGNCDDVVNNKSLKDINDFVFSIGDELKFTAYSGIGEVSIMDSPEGDHIYDFQFAGIPCPGTPTVTDIDGNVYNTVLVGSQCWMKENLKTMTYNNGTPIQNLTDSSSWNNYYTPGYVWYDNDISWKDLYGALYNWNAANDTNGLCPAGWHVPTHDEWTMLTDFIGGISTPKGNELKSCRQVNSPLGGNCNTTDHPRWNESSDEWGTDAYGFSGLPGGFRDIYGGFNNIGTDGLWWSATEAGLSVYHRGLYFNTGTVHISTWAKRNGFSVRCVKNILN